MSGNREDYGPAGCADGCAATMGGMVVLLATLIGLVCRRKGGRR